MLWQKLRRSITDFLTQVWKDGALFGAKPEEAFYVRIDETLNPPSTRSLGRLYIEIGVRPTLPRRVHRRPDRDLGRRRRGERVMSDIESTTTSTRQEAPMANR